jgi:hypothetical protein
VHLHSNENSRFALRLENEKPVLFEDETPLAEVTFPLESGYYHQKTTAGHPFGSIAVLEGRSTLAFFYLWSCDYIKTNETGSFCFQVKADMAGYNLPSAWPAEVAEIIGWAIQTLPATNTFPLPSTAIRASEPALPGPYKLVQSGTPELE